MPGAEVGEAAPAVEVCVSSHCVIRGIIFSTGAGFDAATLTVPPAQRKSGSEPWATRLPFSYNIWCPIGFGRLAPKDSWGKSWINQRRTFKIVF